MFWHDCRATSFSSLRLIYRRFFFVTESLSFKKKCIALASIWGCVYKGFLYTDLSFIFISFHFDSDSLSSLCFARFDKFLSKNSSAWHLRKMLHGHKFSETQFIPVDVPDWNSFHGIRKFRSGCSHIVIKIGRVSRKHSFKQNVFINAEYNTVIRGRELRELVTV